MGILGGWVLLMSEVPPLSCTGGGAALVLERGGPALEDAARSGPRISPGTNDLTFKFHYFHYFVLAVKGLISRKWNKNMSGG